MSTLVVDPNTFVPALVIPIPLPVVFFLIFFYHSTSTSPFLTQTYFCNTGDLVPIGSSPTSRPSSEFSADLELSPSTTTSQVSELQFVTIPAQNSHPRHTRSKSGIFKKTKAFHAQLHYVSGT